MWKTYQEENNSLQLNILNVEKFPIKRNKNRYSDKNKI